MEYGSDSGMSRVECLGWQRRLFVGNLGKAMSSRDFWRAASRLWPDVVNAFVVKDARTRRSRGFGFVQFQNEVRAQQVLEQCRGSKHVRMRRRKVRVNAAMPKKNHDDGDEEDDEEEDDEEDDEEEDDEEEDDEEDDEEEDDEEEDDEGDKVSEEADNAHKMSKEKPESPNDEQVAEKVEELNDKEEACQGVSNEVEVSIPSINETFNQIPPLPEDCIREILSYFTLREASKFSRVNRSWYEASNSLWRCRQSLSFDKDLELTIKYGRPKPKVKLDLNLMRQLLKKTKGNLRKLDTWTMNARQLPWPTLLVIGESCPNLVEIDLTPFYLTPKIVEKFVRLMGDELKSIKFIGKCDHLNDNIIYKLLKRFGKLNHMEIVDQQKFLGWSLKAVPRSMESCYIGECTGFRAEGLLRLAQNAPDLKALSVAHCFYLNTDYIQELPLHFKNCQSLALTNLHKGPSDPSVNWSNFESLHQLTHLDVSFNGAVNKHLILALSRGCKSLQNLCMSACFNEPRIDDSSMRALAKLKELRVLKCNYSCNITGQGFGEVVHLPNLQEFHFMAPVLGNLRLEQVVTVLMSSSSLKLLNLCGWEGELELTDYLEKHTDLFENREQQIGVALSTKVLKQYSGGQQQFGCVKLRFEYWCNNRRRFDYADLLLSDSDSDSDSDDYYDDSDEFDYDDDSDDDSTEEWSDEQSSDENSSDVNACQQS